MLGGCGAVWCSVVAGLYQVEGCCFASGMVGVDDAPRVGVRYLMCGLLLGLRLVGEGVCGGTLDVVSE